MTWSDTIANWGSTAAERARPFACDEVLAVPDQTLFRAVDVDAAPDVTFRWLCQLRVAPYSYDKLDNLGRRSPQTLTAGLDELEIGQRVMKVFRLVSFEPGRSLTVRTGGALFGDVVCTYCADPRGDDEQHSRIVVKLIVAHDFGAPHRALLRLILPPGDLVMMRRQLLNLKGLAEGG